MPMLMDEARGEIEDGTDTEAADIGAAGIVFLEPEGFGEPRQGHEIITFLLESRAAFDVRGCQLPLDFVR